jgi:SP family arabinose:H+ symporter-like MFS transporter
MITVGILVSYLVALIILKVAPGSAGGLDWRLILGIGAIPALVAVALRARMPESPRWLMLKGALRRHREGIRPAGHGRE